MEHSKRRSRSIETARNSFAGLVKDQVNSSRSLNALALLYIEVKSVLSLVTGEGRMEDRHESVGTWEGSSHLGCPEKT
jgi:hypothetical protein